MSAELPVLPLFPDKFADPTHADSTALAPGHEGRPPELQQGPHTTVSVPSSEAGDEHFQQSELQAMLESRAGALPPEVREGLVEQVMGILAEACSDPSHTSGRKMKINIFTHRPRK